MTIYEYTDYIEVLRQFFTKQAGQSGIKTQFALACGCKLSYLSQVLSESAHFTLDHAFGAASFMGFDDDETQYFLLLVQLSRAATHAHKTYLKNQMKSLREREYKLAKKIRSSNKLSNENLQQYYSDCLYQTIHMYLTIPKFQKFSNLKDRLGLPAQQLRSVLLDLEKMGLVEVANETWTPVLKDMHVPLDSPISIQRHLQWKMRAITDMQRKTAHSVHYEATFSLSSTDVERLKQLLFDFIASSRELALKSPEEEVAHLDISFFRV